MPGWVTFNLAAFMPFCFAGVATLLALRSIKRQWWLYFLLAVFVFAGAQEIGLAPLQDFGSGRGVAASERIARDTKTHMIADVVSAIVGGLIMWRTAKVFQR